MRGRKEVRIIGSDSMKLCRIELIHGKGRKS
jgi:hypothetical protein